MHRPLCLCIALFSLLSGNIVVLAIIPLALALSLYVSRGLLVAFHQASGPGFAAAAALHYVTLYPVAVGIGALAGSVHALTAGRGEWEER